MKTLDLHDDEYQSILSALRHASVKCRELEAKARLSCNYGLEVKYARESCSYLVLADKLERNDV